MNKRVVLSISLILLMGIVGFVYALSTPTTVEVKIFKGWNLISMQAEHYSQSDSLKFSDFKYVYVYDSENKEYLLLISNGQEIENVEPKTGFIKEQYDKVMAFGNRLRSQGTEQNFASQTAVWAYSEKEGKIDYQSESQSLISLNAGWNFVGITPDMFEEKNGQDVFSWNNIKGNCNLEKVYAWNPESQDWMPISLTQESFDFNDFIGYGMVVKVSNDCNLGKVGNSINPPVIPNLP